MKVGAVFTATIAVLLMLTVNGSGAPPAGGMNPANGWSLHVDGKLHYPGRPSMIAHHYCKGVAGGLTECQLYDSDGSNARLVGVEVVVPAAMWRTFSGTERSRWHYHKTEIPKIGATLPDLSPEEAAKVAKSLEETYGKVYLLWDPSRDNTPVGMPRLTIIK